jgi:hypothetical protein
MSLKCIGPYWHILVPYPPPPPPDQWPGLVVKLGDEDLYAINTCNDFGLVSGGGVYGMVADAELDIFRRKGMGPASRWVDDHFFVRIP